MSLSLFLVDRTPVGLRYWDASRIGDGPHAWSNHKTLGFLHKHLGRPPHRSRIRAGAAARRSPP